MPAKDVLVCVPKVVEPEFWQSSHHLRNSLKITGLHELSHELGSTV